METVLRTKLSAFVTERQKEERRRREGGGPCMIGDCTTAAAAPPEERLLFISRGLLPSSVNAALSPPSLLAGRARAADGREQGAPRQQTSDRARPAQRLQLPGMPTISRSKWHKYLPAAGAPSRPPARAPRTSVSAPSPNSLRPARRWRRCSSSLPPSSSLSSSSSWPSSSACSSA